MSSKKLSPRQKMISMMYIVLIALLAMNVSQEVLNAFVVVNEGIANSNELINSKNAQLYGDFTKLVDANDSASININKLVLETQKLTNESIRYINNIKDELKEQSGIKEEANGKILFAKLDDLETGTRLLTVETLNQKSKGELLREELAQIYNKYLEIVDKGNPTVKNTPEYTNYKDIYSRTISLQEINKFDISKDGEKISWVNKNFYNVPVVATDVILSKIQNDIYTTEAQVLAFLKSQIKADVIDFDQLSAAVISPKSYLPAGKVFTADIFVAAASSKQESEVFIGKIDKSKFERDSKGSLKSTNTITDDLFFLGNYEKVPIENGKAKFEKITSGVGLRNYEGIIRVKKPIGGYDLYPFAIDYEVAPKAGFSIAPSALNVLYVGLENPLSVTVSDSKEADISIVTDNGTVQRKNGKWFAKVSKTGKANIDVYGVIAGEKKKVGTQLFRIKRVPNPISTLDGIAYDGSITLAKLKSHKAILPYLRDFVYDVNFKVISYDFIHRNNANDIKQEPSIKGAFFTKNVKRLINNSKRGDMVFFQNITVKGPDGKNRKINPIILKIN